MPNSSAFVGFEEERESSQNLVIHTKTLIFRYYVLWDGWGKTLCSAKKTRVCAITWENLSTFIIPPFISEHQHSFKLSLASSTGSHVKKTLRSTLSQFIWTLTLKLFYYFCFDNSHFFHLFNSSTILPLSNTLQAFNLKITNFFHVNASFVSKYCWFCEKNMKKQKNRGKE